MDDFDVVVVGVGAAGLAAGLTLARALRSVVLFDGGDTRNSRADHSHGILGLDGMSPAELSGRGRAEVERFGGVIRRGEVTGAELDVRGRFVLTTTSGEKVACRQLLVASGVRDEIPAVSGVLDLWGDGVVICPYCDGWEARGSDIAILGTGPKSVSQAHLLRQWSDRVTLFTNGVVRLDEDEASRLARRGIRVVESTIDAVRRQHERVILITGQSQHECDVVFTAPRPLPDNRVLAALGVEMVESAAARLPMVDSRGATSVPGVWAAGNAVNPSLKYSTALGAGMDVATHINEALVTADIDNAVAGSPGLI